MRILKVGIIYKITYPNGKIYVGQDWTNDINYFGSADSLTIAKDFPKNIKLFFVTKSILRKFRNVSVQVLNKEEKKWIDKLQSNDPKVGYNRTGRRRRFARSTFIGKAVKYKI